MDLIEVLWKNDVDLGYSLDVATGKSDKSDLKGNNNDTTTPTTSIGVESDDIEKLKTLKALNDEKIKVSGVY